jgi:hypothetical protein
MPGAAVIGDGLLVRYAAQGDVMAFVRKCEQCGSVDARQSWSSAAEAADQGAFQKWTCPTCAWTEFDLVEETETAEATSR